ncbi:MAG: GtrA family protein [Gammaproteobacteria bacterium]|nr:GtrA family protein [Gammaproteobacteria bacterium]
MQKAVKFIMVGGVNTLLTFLLYVVLVGSGWNFNVALIVTYIVGIMLGFFLNMLWTFRPESNNGVAGKQTKFARYLMVYILVFLVNFLILNLLVAWQLLNPIWGQLVAISVATLFSFVLQNKWVFRAPDKR